jgi:tetratricopeptide (TPR) repeat protein
MFRATRLIAAALLVACLPATAWAKWTRLRTEHFVFVGNASESTIRQVAQKLDQFREVLTRALPEGVTKSPVPTVVIVFDSDRSFTPYKPHFNGRAIELAGVFQGGEDVNYIAVNAAAMDDAFTLIFHEYTHFIVGNTAGIVPVWVNEGLAEVYATFQERSGGKSAMLGMPQPRHVELLRGTSLMPLRELMAVDRTSPVYNEGNRRGVFYAESWALVHYLMFGDETRKAQLRTYLTGLKGGAPVDQALRDAFGPDIARLEEELHRYVRRFRFQALRFDFSEKISGAGSERGLPIDDAEARAYLGDMLGRIDRADDARVLFRTLIDSNPQSARAAYGLGALELKAGRLNEALPLLERAVALDAGDAGYQTALGRALLAKWDEERTDTAAADTLQRARAVLARAAELDPQRVNTLVMLGRAELIAGTDLARAASLFEQAVRMAPAREQYRLQLAQCLIEQGEFAKARAYLGPLVARGSFPEIRDAARRLLGATASRSAAPAGNASGGAIEDRASISADPAAPPRREAPSPPAFTPVLRPVGVDERRVLAVFTAVECRRNTILFQFIADDRPLHLAASKFDEVEFITYRPEPPGFVKCGAVQPSSRVLATYRPAESPGSPVGIVGLLVAIEILPDGYTPK